MNLTVRVRLIVTGIVAVFMVILAGGAGIYGMHQEKNSIENIGGNWMPSVGIAKDIGIFRNEVAIGMRDHVLADTPEEREQAQKKLDESISKMRSAIDKYLTSYVSSDVDKSLAQKVKDTSEEYLLLVNDVIALSDTNNDIEAIHKISQAVEVRKKTNLAVDNLLQFNEDGAKQSYADALAGYRTSSVIAIVAILVAIILVAGFVFTLMRHVTLSLNELSECFTKLSSLDMRRVASVKTQDEFGRILGQYNQTISKLKMVVGSTKESSDSVSAASSELSASMDTVAAATEEQSASLTEIATAVEETSASAAAVLGRTNESVDMTQKVNNELQQAAVGLKALQEASEGIEEARNVIQDISEQINLLALNAAIEAARAGDAGRGFAVVADEVRKLASSTGVSIQQITERIVKLREAVASTTGGLQRSTSMMQTVKSNADMMIGSVNEQTAAIEQISRSIHEFRTQMVDVARSIHESKQASSSLAETANELSSVANQFTT